MITPFRIGTRGSPLALWQANHVAELLRPLAIPRTVELVEIQTAGDQVRDRPLAQIGGEGVFTKEIQRAILNDTVDLAVHSLKDLPTVPVEGLVLSAVPRRGPTGDVLVSRGHRRFDHLPVGSTIATGSLRRRAQALHRRPDLRVVDIRGNVETRLRKLAEQDIDAMILAQAGLERLGLRDAVSEVLDPSWMVPAVGQGALGLECRADDSATRFLVEQLNDLPTYQAVVAERALLRGLGGGCSVPIGALATVVGSFLTLRACVLRADGSCRLEASGDGDPLEAANIGLCLAHQLLEQGAQELLRP
jgi:hydroxymethylbilane synthase